MITAAVVRELWGDRFRCEQCSAGVSAGDVVYSEDDGLFDLWKCSKCFGVDGMKRFAIQELMR